jgi:uncharacterized 2Fe-2S/4Fe-4S cluster protein (DUF4445 family)
MKSFRILFAPSLTETSQEAGKTILDAAREVGLYIDSQCNGRGKCGKCRVRVVEGKAGPFTQEESEFISITDKALGYRLACMARVAGDMTVLIPQENVLSSEAAKKVFSKRSAVINPAVKAYILDVPKEEGAHVAYFERITTLLAAQAGVKDLSVDIGVLRALAQEMKEAEAEGKATVFVWMDREIVSVHAGADDACLGLALDVGTTTVALYLCDLHDGSVLATASTTNPQVLFGTDIMSRISYSSHHPGQGVRRMQAELVHAVNALIEQMTSGLGLTPERIMDVTVVGNTVMHHIFLGIAPDHLGLWPFSPSVQGSTDVKIREVGLAANPASYAHVLPIEAGFVGADNVAVLLSEEPYHQEGISLTIDLGTNGELVLGNRERLFSCSCATGPALEGAHIASGMRATVGAIEKVRIDPETFEVDYAVIGSEGWASDHVSGDLKPLGLCGSAIIDTVAELFKTGLLGRDGAFKENGRAGRLRKGQTGAMEFVVAWSRESAMGRDIVLTQRDVRQIQLAKGALHGGCRVLMRRLNIDSLPRMAIAGAFGMHIDKENALAIGLFPWIEPEKMDMVGNAAGHGAYLALMNRAKRAEANRIAREVTHIELALEEDFQKEFLRALSIPYKEA